MIEDITCDTLEMKLIKMFQNDIFHVTKIDEALEIIETLNLISTGACGGCGCSSIRQDLSNGDVTCSACGENARVSDMFSELTLLRAKVRALTIRAEQAEYQRNDAWENERDAQTFIEHKGLQGEAYHFWTERQ